MIEQLDFVQKQNYFLLSSITLSELEDIKTNNRKTEDVRYAARKATHYLNENPEKYKVVIYTDEIESYIHKKMIEITPDTKIIGCCAFTSGNARGSCNVVFATNDLACKNIAKNIFSLDVESIKYDLVGELYKGYREITLDDDAMAYFYENPSVNSYDLLPNEYVLLKNSNGEIVDRLKWDGELYQTVRCKPYKSSMFGQLKPLDDIQMFAMDSINNNDITVLYGKAGSGKTTLPLNYIMQEIEKGKYKKCYIVYSYEPLKGAKTLGYEKGTHQEKLLMSASIGNILATKFGDIQQVEFMMERDMLDIVPTANIRGVEFSNSIVFCTESQNLDVYTLKTIVQRCKTGCKQIYEGDIIEQRDTNIQNVGINRLIDVFKGHKSFGCVKLKNNYRGELSELADLM